MAAPTKQQLEERARLSEMLQPEMRIGREYFDAFRLAHGALVGAQEAVLALRKLDRVCAEEAPNRFSQEANVKLAWAIRDVHNSTPGTGMAMIAAMLAQSEDPYYATWKDAEPEALARLMPFVDPYALAAADLEGRDGPAFKSDRFEQARVNWQAFERHWRNSNSGQ